VRAQIWKCQGADTNPAVLLANQDCFCLHHRDSISFVFGTDKGADKGAVAPSPDCLRGF
jgi:hypothetical protein